MTAKITAFPGLTRDAPSVENVLAVAQASELSDVVVIGWRKDGRPYFDASVDGTTANWLLDQSKAMLLAAGMADDLP
jgi:hypothetical protein